MGRRRNAAKPLLTALVLVLATGWVSPVSAAPAAAPTLADFQALTKAVDRFPDQLAGVSTDTLNKITIHTVGTSKLPAAVASTVNLLSAKRTQVTIKPEKHSMRELQRVVDRIPKTAPFSSYTAGLSRWAADPATNRVEVGVTHLPTGAEAAQVQALFGDLVHLYLAPQYVPSGRFDDSPPLYGGDRITGGAGNSCTSGFAIRNLHGTIYTLTAGHCWAVGTAVSTNTYLSRVGLRRWESGSMDNELLENIPGSPVVYTNRSGNIWDEPPVDRAVPVTSAADSCAGCQVFFGGSYTGKSLATLSGPKGNSRICLNASCSQYYDLINTQRAIGQSDICRHGDSGGPVYAFNASGITAVGIITAVGRGPNGEDRKNCVYTSVPDILASWSSTINLG